MSEKGALKDLKRCARRSKGGHPLGNEHTPRKPASSDAICYERGIMFKVITRRA